MRFYIAKGLQLAGFLGVGYALYAGIAAQVSLLGELAMATLGAALFYAGRLLDS